MKKYFLVLTGFLLFTSLAWANDPDLEGRVSVIDYTKSEILVRNELKNNTGNRDYRVAVKQGMINNYKMNDKLKIWLKENSKEASMIEIVKD